MQEYAQKPEKSSSDSNSRSSGQPPISEILQAYKNGSLQRMSVGEEELLQAKTRDKSSERETLQRYTDTHGDKSRYNSLIQGMFDIPQRKGVGNEEPLQGKFDSSSAASESTVQREVKPNNTGLPDNLKSGIENLSGYSMDDVKVHYNSDKPAQLSALAYAQGTDIHVAPGQEKHLPHEAWHVVQQKQGRVQPTVQMQGVGVNDNEGLEKEADVMGRKSVDELVDFHCVNIEKSTGVLSADSDVESKLSEYSMSNNFPMQLKKLILGKLNIVGEHHTESSKRRGDEKDIAKKETGGEYWREDEFRRGKPSGHSSFSDKGKFADSSILRAKLNAILCLSSLKSAILGGEQMSVVFCYCKAALKYCNLVKNQDTSFGNIKNIYDSLYELYKLYDLRDFFKKNTSKILSIKEKIEDALSDQISGKTLIEAFEQLSTDRTRFMEESAEISEGAIGVWKIGNAHIHQWKWKRPHYEIFTREEFNEEYFGHKGSLGISIFDTISNENL